jgi:hypothetical protein
VPSTLPEERGPGVFRAAAIAYAEAGWPIFPVLPDRKAPFGKLVPNGFKDASADPELVRYWWTRSPWSNIGFPTGNGIAVLDVDSYKGARLEGDWPETLTARTARGGEHRYHVVEEEVRISADRLGPGLDVRGDGGYVLLPPSRFGRGKHYTWENRIAPVAVDAARLRGDGAAVLRDTGTRRGRGKRPLPPDWRPFELATLVREGGRHDYLARVAGWLRYHGTTGNELETMLLDHNDHVCIPPLDEEELLKIARWAGRLEN